MNRKGHHYFGMEALKTTYFYLSKLFYFAGTNWEIRHKIMLAAG